MTGAPAGWALRTGRPEDAGEVHVLTRAAFLTVAQQLGDVQLPPLRESLDDVAAALHDPGTVVVVAEALGGGGLGRAGRLVGAVRLHLESGTGHLGRLVVAPDAQRRGIAAALVAAAEDAATRARAAEVELFTGVGQTGALALYRGRGYRDVPAPGADRVSPGGDAPHLVFLRKQLPAAGGQQGRT